jgi:hypothetical protein
VHVGESSGHQNSLCLQAIRHTEMQEMYVADLDMTVDTADESYADRPATTMRVPIPSDVQFSSRESQDSTSLVRSNKALQVCSKGCSGAAFLIRQSDIACHSLDKPWTRHLHFVCLWHLVSIWIVACGAHVACCALGRGSCCACEATKPIHQ